MKIQEQIAFLRKQKGLTQEELAQALGVTNQAVSKWESGQCCPDIQLLPELAKLFEVTVEETKQALEKLPLTVKEEEGELRYRLEGSFCHMPALLTFLFKFR